MIKNIIFDFDGVLVDSEILVAKSLTRYFSSKNTEFNEKEFSKFAGKKTIQYISELSRMYNIKDEKKFFNDIMSITKRLYSNELESVSGALNFLENTNHNRLIGSNNTKIRIIEGLKNVKFDIFFNFDKIYSYDLVGVPKPNPDIYLKALEDSKINTSETIIIEDSALGIKAGVAAGVKVIGITAGGHWHTNRTNQELYEAGAYEVVKNYEEMLILIKKL